jgi:hypothetical protein
MPRPSPDVVVTKDVEAGTRKDVEAGTRKGRSCQSTMKNPPEGFYSPPGGE